MTPELLFEYVFAVIFGIGIAILAFIFVAAMLGFDFWNKD